MLNQSAQENHFNLKTVFNMVILYLIFFLNFLLSYYLCRIKLLDLNR